MYLKVLGSRKVTRSQADLLEAEARAAAEKHQEKHLEVGFRVEGLGFRVQGSGFRVWGFYERAAQVFAALRCQGNGAVRAV